MNRPNHWTRVMMILFVSWIPFLSQAEETDTNVRNAGVDELEEVIVTARRRAEAASDVPITMTVIGEYEIERARIEQVADFVALTSGSTLRENFNPSFTNLTVRGIATQQNGELPVALAVDGVTVPFTSFLNQDLVDVIHVEVLKGPQGGMYGRNAIAGAINIVTRKPTDEFEGTVRANVGVGSYRGLRGSISGPVSATLNGSLGVLVKYSDGLIENGYDGGSLDPVSERTAHGRLIWTPSDSVEVDLRARQTSGETGASWFDVVGVDAIDDFQNDPIISHPAINDRELYELTAKVSYTTSAGTITAIAGRFDVQDMVNGDADFGVFGPPEQLQDFHTLVDGWSGEVRYATSDDQPFRWLVGAFHQDRTVGTYTNILLADGNVPVFLVEDSTNDSVSRALFTQSTLDITDELEMSFALRLDEDARSTVDLAESSMRLSRTFSQVQPKLSVSYKATDRLLVFGTIGNGFRSGGFNGFAAPAELRTFDNEVATTVELGLKFAAVGNRFRWNGSIYRIDYEGQQFFRFEDEFVSAIVNADETRITGAEMDVRAIFSDTFAVYASWGYTDAEITSNEPDFEGNTFVGNTSPGVHRSTAYLGVDTTFPIAGERDITAWIDFERRGSIYYELNNHHQSSPKTFVNARVAVEGELWSVGAYVRNATDERYPLTAESFLGPEVVFRLPSGRRAMGIEATLRF